LHIVKIYLAGVWEKAITACPKTVLYHSLKSDAEDNAIKKNQFCNREANTEPPKHFTTVFDLSTAGVFGTKSDV
jgi:hypothetical protein